MLHHALSGFLRVSLISRCDKVVPEKLFRRRILRDTPAIGSSVSVLHIDEIRDADIALHLQPRDARLKTGVAVLAVVQSLFQPFGKHPAFTGYGFITDCIVVVVRSDIVLSRLQSAFMPVRPTPLQNCVGYDMAVPI